MSAKGKSGFNFYKLLHAQQQEVNTNNNNNSSEDDIKAVVQKLRKEYTIDQISNPLLVKIVEYTNGSELDARSIIDYYLYKPTTEEINDMKAYYIQTGKEYDDKKARNLLKYYKNAAAADAVLVTGQTESPYFTLQSRLFETSSNTNVPTLKKYFPADKNKDLVESTRFHVGIENKSEDYPFNENLCFINTSLQLLYHVPEFRDLILNFNLNDDIFKREFASSKLEPIKGLHSIFNKLQNAEVINQKAINIVIDMNPYFECLWVGPYRLPGKKFETEEQFKKRLEIDVGMYQEADYKPGESEADRRRRIIRVKTAAGQNEAELIKQYAILGNQVNELFDTKDKRDLDGNPLANSKGGGPRKQHDIGEFITKCIFGRLDKTSTQPLLVPFLFQYQEKKDLYFKSKLALEGEIIGGYKKQTIVRDALPDTTLMIYFKDTFDSNDNFYLQNLININSTKLFNTFDANFLFKAVGAKLKDAKLAIDKTDYVFPAKMTHLLIQLVRMNNNLEKVYNPVHINTIIKIGNTFFECVGVGCQFGGINSGHYAYVHKESEGNWIEFNDANVRSRSEQKVYSSFVSVEGLDLSKSGYCFLYEKLTNFSEDQYAAYIAEMNTELAGISSLKKITEIDQNITKENIVQYVTEYERLQQETLEQTSKNVAETTSAETVKLRDIRYYSELLRNKYPKENASNATREIRNKILDIMTKRDMTDAAALFRNSGIITADEYGYFTRKLTEIRASQAKEAEAALKKQGEKETKLVSDTQEKWRQREFELKQAAWRDVFWHSDGLKAEIKKENLKNKFIELLTDLTFGQTKIDKIIGELKAVNLVEFLVFLRLKKRDVEKSNPNYSVLQKFEEKIIKYFENIDIQGDTSYILNILEQKFKGEKIFTEQELFGIGGILKDSYPPGKLEKNKKAQPKKGGSRKRQRTMKKKSTK